MKKIILSQLKKLEDEKEVVILYACEAGSRAWGLDSHLSDYDVRFIYVHPPTFYLQIDAVGTRNRVDTMEFSLNKEIEFTGWELSKTLRLFRKSNPTLLEWLHSEIQYHQSYSTYSRMMKLENEIFSKISTLHHYFNMARKNYVRFQKQEVPSTKLLLNIVRPILMASWIIRYENFPPVHVSTALNKLYGDTNIYPFIQSLIQAKKEGSEITKTTDVSALHLFIEKELESIKEHLDSISPASQLHITEKLNNLFQKTLIEIWGNFYNGI